MLISKRATGACTLNVQNRQHRNRSVVCGFPIFNSLWPGDAIWRIRTGSTLAQVVAYCPMTPSYYLNLCSLFIGEAQWQSLESNFTKRYLSHRSLKLAWKLLNQIFHSNLPGVSEFKTGITQAILYWSENTHWVRLYSWQILIIEINSSIDPIALNNNCQLEIAWGNKIFSSNLHEGQLKDYQILIIFGLIYYPRPVLAFGYCHRLRLWVCVSVFVCVYQSRACPHDNSSPIQARITKFGPEMQNTLVWVPIVFGDDRPWSSRSNLTWKSNFTPFWACSHHYSSAIQARITKFWPKMHLSTVKIPTNFGLDWFWSSLSFSILKPIFLPNLFALPDNIRDRACAVLHSRWAGHPICGPSWIIAIWLSYCSVNPLRPQNCIYLQSDLSCL